MNTVCGVVLLLGAAALAMLMHLSWLVPLTMLVLLAAAGLILLLSSNAGAKKMADGWWAALRRRFTDKGGWPLWEAVSLGVIVFGVFAGTDFLVRALVILSAFLAPWLAGLWAARRRADLPALQSTFAGAVVGVVEGGFFLAWLPSDWQEFPAWLLALVVSGLVGAALGFWACARGQIRLEKGMDVKS